MNKLFFFDLRPYPRYPELSGKELDLKYLIETVKEPEFANHPDLYLSKDEADTILQFNTKTSNWEKAVRTTLLLIGGKTITNQSLNIYKEIYRNIERDFDKQINLDFNFVTFFVTMMLGFQAHIYGWSEHNTNKSTDFVKFVEKILEKRNDRLFVCSIFCPHRESDTADKNTLVKEIKEISVRRYVFLLYSLFLNAGSKQVDITLYHPIGSAHALSIIFPNITLKYMHENRVGELLEQMDKHFYTVESIINSVKKSSVSIKFIAVDKLIEMVENGCEKLCGIHWRLIDNFNSIKDEDIKTITRDMTLNDVRRYMPEYESKSSVEIDTHSLSDREKGAINLYLGDDKLQLHSKSLYETLFYYTLGKITKDEDGIAIGIDRDHDLFQVQAFSLGYSGIVDISNGTPLLYARRTDAELLSDDINSASFRQQWRLSENNIK